MSADNDDDDDIAISEAVLASLHSCGEEDRRRAALQSRAAELNRLFQRIEQAPDAHARKRALYCFEEQCKDNHDVFARQEFHHYMQAKESFERHRAAASATPHGGGH